MHHHVHCCGYLPPLLPFNAPCVWALLACYLMRLLCSFQLWAMYLQTMSFSMYSSQLTRYFPLCCKQRLRCDLSLPCPPIPMHWINDSPLSMESDMRLGVPAMHFLYALTKAVLASTDVGSDVANVTFISGARKCCTMSVRNELLHTENLHDFSATCTTAVVCASAMADIADVF
jgi:hypothetical protein